MFVSAALDIVATTGIVEDAPEASEMMERNVVRVGAEFAKVPTEDDAPDEAFEVERFSLLVVTSMLVGRGVELGVSSENVVAADGIAAVALGKSKKRALGSSQQLGIPAKDDSQQDCPLSQTRTEYAPSFVATKAQEQR